MVQSGLPAAANGIVAAVWQSTLPGARRTGDGPLPASTGRNSLPLPKARTTVRGQNFVLENLNAIA